MSFGIRGAFGGINTHPSGQCTELPMETVTVTVLNADATAKTKGSVVNLEYSSGWTIDTLADADINATAKVGGMFAVCAEDIPASGLGKVHLKGRVEALGGATIAAGTCITAEAAGEVRAAAADDEQIVIGFVAEAALSDGALGHIYFDGFATNQNANTAG